jgi:hypothetical protein
LPGEVIAFWEVLLGPFFYTRYMVLADSRIIYVV